VSFGGISDAMKDAVGRELTPKKTLEQIYKKDPARFFDQFWKNYSMTDEKDSKDEFLAKLEKKNVDWLMSKYMVVELFSAIDGWNSHSLSQNKRILT
jgi:hypothetical protein